ncbi:MAG: hypothetical protein GY749_46515 [Desulfobacteraceae bacterium]|nr:hypothetical protein [Desulfobacteraceae bacterium]
MENKQCMFCKKIIDEEAQKCPYCQSWQSKWELHAHSPNPKTLLLTIVFLFAAVATFIIIISQRKESERESEPKVSFNVLKIAESSLETFDRGDSKYLAVLGKIENKSEFSWRNVFFHVDLFDSNNNLIDAFSDKNYYIVIPANSNTTFRIRAVPIRNLSEYSSHKVYIRRATKMCK